MIFRWLLIVGISGLCAMDSYSLKDIYGFPLDHKILQRIPKQGGVFIEVGAGDGLEQSNTALLEKQYEWHGILVEPSPAIYAQLCANRPNSVCYSCALGSFLENDTYVWGDFDRSLMSSVGGVRRGYTPTVQVYMRSVQSILDELVVTHVDFFSIDVEGYEYNVLQGIDFNKVSIDYLLIEVYTWEFEQIVRFLRDKGYDLLENFSLYDCTMTDWDGTHNDYLFKRRGL